MLGSKIHNFNQNTSELSASREIEILFTTEYKSPTQFPSTA